MKNGLNRSRIVWPRRTFAKGIMKSTFQPIHQRCSIRLFPTLGLLVGLLWASGLRAQSPDEHASHHPGQAGGATPGAAPGTGAMPAAGGMGDMGEMMKGMGGAKGK